MEGHRYSGHYSPLSGRVVTYISDISCVVCLLVIIQV